MNQFGNGKSAPTSIIIIVHFFIIFPKLFCKEVWFGLKTVDPFINTINAAMFYCAYAPILAHAYIHIWANIVGANMVEILHDHMSLTMLAHTIWLTKIYIFYKFVSSEFIFHFMIN